MTYNVKLIGNGTWCISEYGVVHMFLLEGNERAILVDTGAGIGDLKGLVETLTDKPYQIVNTHGHVDHAGGNGQFAEVWMEPADVRLADWMCVYKERQEYVRTRVEINRPEQVGDALEAVLPDHDYVKRELTEGTLFELGDRLVEVIATPGHTLGSICLLDRKERFLLTGDMANDTVVIHKKYNGTSVEDFRNSMVKLWNLRTEYDYLLRCHEEPCVGNKIVLDLLELAEGLLSGTRETCYEKSGIREGVCAKHGKCCVWFDGDNLIEEK